LISNAQIFVHDDSTKHGPIDDNAGIGHATQYSPLFEDSILCAQCHDVSNTFVELIDDDGTPLGIPVPIERTYSEWRDSAYSDTQSPDHATCMDCHMKAYQGYAATVGNPPERELHTHRLVGANVMVPQMVSYLYNDGTDVPFLGGVADAANAAADAARQQLTEAAVLSATSLTDLGNDTWALAVRVENTAGHKLPTGYAEGRRMFLGHDVEWADGTPGPRTGIMNTTTWDFNVGQEPVRTWEVLLSEGLEQYHSFHFVKVNRIIKDNRIPPKGFVPRVDTPIVGGDYPEQPDGTRAYWDEVELFLGNSDCWPAIVTATLMFQSSSGPYLDFLIANSPTYGPDLQAALAIVGAAPNPMQEIEVAVFPDGTIEPAAGPYLCEPGPGAPPPVVDAGNNDPPPVVDAGNNEPPPPPTPPRNNDNDPGGCTCAARGAPDVALLGFALLLGVAVRRRRR
jgi:MYXO-CTERM domain-containing protein